MKCWINAEYRRREDSSKSVIFYLAVFRQWGDICSSRTKRGHVKSNLTKFAQAKRLAQLWMIPSDFSSYSLSSTSPSAPIIVFPATKAHDLALPSWFMTSRVPIHLSVTSVRLSYTSLAVPMSAVQRYTCNWSSNFSMAERPWLRVLARSR